MLGRNFFLYLSILVSLFNILEVRNIMNSISEDSFIKPPHVSMDEYDEQVFRAPTKS